MKTLRAELEKLETKAPATTPEERDALDRYYALLQEWNEKSSLVSPKTLETALTTHFVDSLFLSDIVGQTRQRMSIVDIGSGGGFPGLVIAMRHPRVPVSLFERTEKKREFLLTVVETLGLDNVGLNAEFTGKHKPALFISRAMMPRDRYLPMMRRSAPAGSRVLTCLGGSKPIPQPEPGYRRLDVVRYELPNDAGPRMVEVLERLQ